MTIHNYINTSLILIPNIQIHKNNNYYLLKFLNQIYNNKLIFL